LEKDRNRARSRRKPQPLRFKPVTIGDAAIAGLSGILSNPEILRLPKRMPAPEVSYGNSTNTLVKPMSCSSASGMGQVSFWWNKRWKK
jgi:hypothetical protein